MKIAAGSDHAGFELKQTLIDLLRQKGHEVSDMGTDSSASVDYPDFAEAVGKKVSSGECNAGLLVCGSGIGIGIAANKTPGIRAATVWSRESAVLSRAHNDANIICLGARLVEAETAKEAASAFFETDFEQGRHVQRVDKINDMLPKPQ